MNQVKIVLAAALVAAPLVAVSTPAAAGAKVKSGSEACPATYFFRKGGLERHDSLYALRNYNGDRTVTIERVRVWDQAGDILFDGLPAGVDTFSSSLGPHQSARFSLSNLGLLPAAPVANVYQLRLDYSLDKKGLPLAVGFVHITTDIPTNAQISRQTGTCRLLPRSAD